MLGLAIAAPHPRTSKKLQYVHARFVVGPLALTHTVLIIRYKITVNKIRKQYACGTYIFST